MKDLGKVTFKFKLGGGLNALCVAGASAIAVHSLIKLGDWIVNNDLKKLVRESNAVLGDIKKKIGEIYGEYFMMGMESVIEDNNIYFDETVLEEVED